VLLVGGLPGRLLVAEPEGYFDPLRQQIYGDTLPKDIPN